MFALQALSSLVGGESMRQTVWVWQVLTVLAWLGVRWLLLRASADPVRVDLLWTANPLAFAIGVLGAVLDVVAAALALAALLLAARSPLAERERSRWLARAVTYAAAALAVAVPLHLWAGPHVFDQLGRARRSVSLATPWRLLVDGMAGSSSVRSWVFAGSVVLFAGFVWVLWRPRR